MQFDKEFRMTIGGAAIAGATIAPVINPATEDVVANAPIAGRDQLDAAVMAARRALPAWSACPVEERKSAIFAIADCLEKNVDELHHVFTAEQGKPLSFAQMEIMYSAMWCRAIAAQDLPIEVVEDTAERRVEVRRVPIGVVGAIVPWNFPLLLAFWKIAPALLTGNTLVLKPSPFTPLTMLRIGELLQEILPPGVLNIVSGDDDLGPWMTAHPDIDKIAFTGSCATGRKVMASASSTLKRLTLELGGNDAAIVMPDIDVSVAAESLFWGAFLNSAQLCVATKRMFIHESVYDRVAAALVEYARNIKVGDGAEQGTVLGPIQNRPQYERVCSLIEDSQRQGHKFLVGGEIPQGKGYFVPITIVDNPPDDSRVVTEEAFGPILPLLKYRDIDEVVRRANETHFGLGGSVWGTDLDQARNIAERLETGTVWINEIHYNSPLAPIGGHKQSGLGVENGRDGLLSYTNAKTLVIRKGAIHSLAAQASAAQN